jgi:hypothetical protein
MIPAMQELYRVLKPAEWQFYKFRKIKKATTFADDALPTKRTR